MMRRAAAVTALPLALLASGCTTDRTELLLTPYCPTKIDVFGGAGVLLAGTGGPAQPPRDLTKGFAAGDPGFEKTLAGRLQAALVADAEIVRRFGADIRVRACGDPFASLSSFARAVVTEPCQGGGPMNPGELADVCTSDPAPVAVLVSSEMGDRCHGGDFSPASDVPADYAAHLEARIENFLAERRAHGPLFAFIGPQTHWEPMPRPMGMGGPPDVVTCAWRIPHWSRLGVSRWQHDHPTARDARIAGDLLDEFAARDDICCPIRQATACVAGDPWMTKRDGTPLLVNEAGAQQIAKLWVEAVRGWMLAGQFRCD